MRRTGLRLRITLLVVAYMLLLSLAVVYHGNVVNERAEKLVWRSLLQSELDHYLSAHAPRIRIIAGATADDVALYGERRRRAAAGGTGRNCSRACMTTSGSTAASASRW